MKGQSKELATKEKIKQSIILQIQGQKSTTLPSCGELSEEERKKVEQYVSNIEQKRAEEIQAIYEELDISIKTIQTGNLSVRDMIEELIGLIGRRTKVIYNIDIIRQKLEEIRCELRLNAGKLDVMFQTSNNLYKNMQYLIIALQELSNRTGGDDSLDEETIGVFSKIEINARMLRFLAIYNEELARCYERKIPELTITESKSQRRLTSDIIETLRELIDIQQRGELKMKLL